MKPIYIQGVGVISRCALNFEDLLKIAADESYSTNFDEKLTFPPNAPSSKIRRAPRYTRMAVSAAAQAKKASAHSLDSARREVAHPRRQRLDPGRRYGHNRHHSLGLYQYKRYICIINVKGCFTHEF